MSFQSSYLLALLVVGLVISHGKKSEPENRLLSRGWGNSINWAQTYEEALSKMKKSQKPLMVIHHLPECPHSQALKKVFAANEEIQKMAREDFIMLNLMEETSDKNLAPDGYYVPRIVFVDPTMVVRDDIVGKYDNGRYVYEPGDIDTLKDNMIEAKKLLHSEL
ncbi:anterior gradient protein 3-like [Brienomyrus brachyistius]|uniref:anterior gradient protein 3-like n=1 Tax=Brienomyrus brachyistius TaxID=42636 RepID=UPI0020B2DDFC|nr:anterior gradient protein 3-like [Brienomyrus brachyistius]